MGLFAKLREGLTKTRDSLMGRVDTLVKETRKIDEDFYEELEDILLMSDCGMKATTAMMDELRRRVSENKVKDAPGVHIEVCQFQGAGRHRVEVDGALPGVHPGRGLGQHFRQDGFIGAVCE